MRVFKDVGLVEQLGSGMSRILKVYAKTIFQISEYFIKVTFPFYDATSSNGTTNGTTSGTINDTVKSNFQKIEATNEAVLSIIRETPSVTLVQLAEKLHCSRRTVSRWMKQLQTDDKLKRVGSNKVGSWVIVDETP